MAEGDFFNVDAQWALQGKTLGRSGYRVLASSTGTLSAENFAEAINRFSMGTPETLPQVTISWLNQGLTNYLALAIHQLASDAQTPDGQLTVRDDDGRPVVATRYYCVPYEPMAANLVPYQALHEAFAAARLRPVPEPPLSLKLPKPPAEPPAGNKEPALDLLAIQAAALLVTRRPVCVLGGQAASTTDRLGFIDTVMTLLPWGFRARMAAATWTRATNQNHRFRLFFSGAQRDIEHPDQVIHWGRPELTNLSQHEDAYLAYWYEKWLNTEPVDLTRSVLSRLTKPRSLASREEVQEALNETGSHLLSSYKSRSDRRNGGAQLSVQAGSRNGPVPVRDTAEAARQAEVERCLLDCAQHLKMQDLPLLVPAIGQLRNAVKGDITPGQRTRYREMITEHQLFRHDLAAQGVHEGRLRDTEGKLRETLLKIAFDSPLSYGDYCLIEEGIGDELSPDSALLQLIEKTGLGDIRVRAVTYRQLPKLDAEKKLSKWFSSRDLSAVQLLDSLAPEVKRPGHARLLCDVTIDYLRRVNRHDDDPRDIRRVLRQHSYLSLKLQDRLANQEQYQINALACFLQAAYPDKLARQDVYTILTGTEERPTFPFLAAIMLLLRDPGDADLARELFVFSSFMAMNLELATKRELERLILPAIPSLQPTVSAVQVSGDQQKETPLQRRVSGPQPPGNYLAHEEGTHQPQEGVAAAPSPVGPQPGPGSAHGDVPRSEGAVQQPEGSYVNKHGKNAPRAT